MADRVLALFRTAETADRPPVPGWIVRTVVLGEQADSDDDDIDLAKRLADKDCLIVTSPRAAAWVNKQALPPERRKPVFVAGPATGAVLANGRWDVRVPALATGGEAAVRMLAAAGFRRPLFVGARETAGTVEATCRSLNLDLEHLAAYATKARKNLDPSELPDPVVAQAAAFLAPSAVRFLEKMAPTYFRQLALTRPAAACGEATLQALRELGWRDIRPAPGPDLQQLVQAFGGTMSSRELFARSLAVTPGGVHSPVRAFRNVGAEPFYVASAKGSRLTTVDGKELVDWVGSWGPMVLGHSHPAVGAAIQSSLASGSSFGACSIPEVELSEEICRRNPWVQKVRLVSSGTEATMSALRLARGFTGRPAFIKFRGCYHGHGDSFLVAAGSGALTHGHPSSPGVTPDTAKDTLVAEFNDLESVEAAFAARPGEISCIFVEPVPGNMGVVPAQPGFLEGLRTLCDEHGALLVLDEVMTGFRVHTRGAAGLLGIQPDLATYGKIIGGGLPLAAFGGRADIMDKLSPLGPVYQAGTLSGNPLACAAGLALLRELTPEVYTRLAILGERMEKAILPGIAGKPLRFQRVGSMATLFFHDGPVRTFADVAACDNAAFGRFFRIMLDKGHFLPPAQFEAFFLSAAHTEEDVDRFAKDLLFAADSALA